VSTFGGNPVACAAADAVLREIADRDLAGNARLRGEQFLEELAAIRRRFPERVGEVRGLGLMLGIELVRDETVRDRTPMPELAGALMEAARRRGLLVGRGGLHNNVIRLAPPLNVSADEIREGARILAEALADASG
jgi:4-aminobutyrate aminotransferase-like enzyme